jgi:hypothetical protein
MWPILSGGASRRNVRASKNRSARFDLGSRRTAAEASQERERYQGNGAACATVIRLLGEGFRDVPWLSSAAPSLVWASSLRLGETKFVWVLEERGSPAR